MRAYLYPAARTVWRSALGVNGDYGFGVVDCVRESWKFVVGAGEREREGNSGAARGWGVASASDDATADGELDVGVGGRGDRFTFGADLEPCVSGVSERAEQSDCGSDGLKLARVRIFGGAGGGDLPIVWPGAAIRASAGAPMNAMRGARTSTATREKNGLRRLLVMSQVALSMVLLVAALLFSKSLQKVLATNLGFDARNVLVARVTVSGSDLENNQEKRQAVYRELKERIDSLSGVTSAAQILITPISGSGWNDAVHADDDPTHIKGKECWFNRAGPRYFATMGTPLVAGRDFDSHDNLNAPKVAVVNQEFAKKVLAGRTRSAEALRVEAEGNEPEAVYQIVGLVRDTHYRDIEEGQRLIAFLPSEQDAKPGSDQTFVIKGRGSLDSLQAEILQTTGALNPSLLVDFRVLDTQIQESVLRERLMANLSLAFGVLAGLLSTLGLYGVMSYLVVRRRSEIGLRMALGASQGNVYGLIAKDAYDHGVGGIGSGCGRVCVFGALCGIDAVRVEGQRSADFGVGGRVAGDHSGCGNFDTGKARGAVGADGRVREE